MADQARKDLVLAPGEYAFTRDVSKGSVKVHTGPMVVTMSGQEEPIRFDAKKGFIPCDAGAVVQKSAFVPEGFYAELSNPAKDANKTHPTPEISTISTDLLLGQRVNVFGPDMFSLWPGQSVKVIRGHQLGLNEYLLCRVTNEEKARAHWKNTVAKAAESSAAQPPSDGSRAPSNGIPMPEDLSVGRLFVIKGTDVSFYMPPTGVKVVPEGSVDDGKEKYTRDALTLEQLEYAILVNQSGEKRYERGPKVVFPEPTERFMEADGHKKSRAIEMNPISGILIRVIADYEIRKGEPAPKPLGAGFDGTHYHVGDELFITGNDTSLYFPREEHQLVTYDGKAKHFAVAIPEGEARYVLNRLEGSVDRVNGPKMFLPDPRTQVIVRRILSQKQCELWYPGNAEVASYNGALAQLAVAAAPATRQGTVSESDVERAKGGGNVKQLRSAQGALMERASQSNNRGLMAEEAHYASSFTQPRTLTLNTKMDGVVSVEPWTGHAVMVVGKDGSRRVELGPKTVLLDYDESLEVLELSMGKPKSTDTLYKTVYLRTNANKVSDIIEVETNDHVKVNVSLSYRVSFEGEDPKKWFNVSNYVKLLCDHGRSLLKNAARKQGIEDFYKKAIDVIRDTILGTSEEGKPRPGLLFPDNSMRVTDVEVLSVELEDSDVAETLSRAQMDAFEASILISTQQRKLDLTRKQQEIARAIDEETAKTAEAKARLETAETSRKLALALAQIDSSIRQADQRKALTQAEQDVKSVEFDVALARQIEESTFAETVAKAELERKLQHIKADTEATVARFAAAKDGLSETVAALTHAETATRIAEAMSVQQFIGGKNVTEVLIKVFGETKLGELLRKKVLDVAPVSLANGEQAHPRA